MVSLNVLVIIDSAKLIYMTNLICELIISFIKKNSFLSSCVLTQIKYYTIYSIEHSNYLHNECKWQIPFTHSHADRYFSKTIKRMNLKFGIVDHLMLYRCAIRKDFPKFAF